MTQFIQHTTNPRMVDVFVAFFLPNDHLHWIPNGGEQVECIVDAEDFDDDPIQCMTEAAERWCEQTQGPGRFWSIVLDCE
tara:strand:- start:106 stop:345 length:240 start_codon:yes stop_codon:yes gene_type:complete